MSRPKQPHLRQGNRTKAEQSTVEVVDSVPGVPDGVPEVPPAPDYLDDVGTALWDQVWLKAGAAYIAGWDDDVVGQYCTLSSEIWSIERKLNPPNRPAIFMTKGSQGQMVIHPLRKHLDRLRADRLRVMKELGMTPEARARLGIAFKKVRSELEEFLDE